MAYKDKCLLFFSCNVARIDYACNTRLNLGGPVLFRKVLRGINLIGCRNFAAQTETESAGTWPEDMAPYFVPDYLCLGRDVGWLAWNLSGYIEIPAGFLLILRLHGLPFTEVPCWFSVCIVHNLLGADVAILQQSSAENTTCSMMQGTKALCIISAQEGCWFILKRFGGIRLI